MQFKIGEIKVYPHHGAAIIESISSRIIKGEEYECINFRVISSGLLIELPRRNAEYVGVRDIVSPQELKKVFSLLKQPYIEEPTNWSRRFKANVEKLDSGDVFKIAEVVRDLYRRQKEKGPLSNGERRMLNKAMKQLSDEVALAEQSDSEAAEVRILEILAA
ncbi:MAG: CarD family transcriptional regulator [Candidatus Nanopelagicales bacterium]